MLRTTRQRAAEAAVNTEVAALQRENERLRLMLSERVSHGASKSGYLNKYRPYTVSSLWAKPWEARYCVLRGNRLTYFRSERDVHFPPRGEIALADTVVEMQGLRRRRFWTFQVVDPAGVALIRLSTEVHADYVAWVDALERAGCVRRDDSRSPGPSLAGSPSNSGISTMEDTTDTAASGGGGGGQQQQRSGQWRHQAEVDSGAEQQQRLRSQPSGYTSDASDVGRHQRLPPRGSTRSTRSTPGWGPGDACAPVHTQRRASLLSSERITVSNQSGLVTLAFIVLAATNFRLILENMIKYGLRFNPFTFLRAALTPSGNGRLFLCWPGLLVVSFAALGIEQFAAARLEAELREMAAAKKKHDDHEDDDGAAGTRVRTSEALLGFLNFANTTLALAAPCAVIHYTDAEPIPGFALTLASSVLWLKLVSFAHVNWAIRKCRRHNPRQPCPGETHSGQEPAFIEDDVVEYPKSLTPRNLLYFLAAPTLCYQLSYPRSERLRLRWMLRRVVMLCGALGMMLFIMEQYIQPTIDNSLKPLREMDWLRMAERILKLSIPTLYFWLAMFYGLFDLWLNVLAEATRFGDREFYKEWWNATTLGEYWRLWNMPVHKWMLRHLYFPLIGGHLPLPGCQGRKCPKFLAGVIVFLVSALFHELLVGVPLHMMRWWAFWGIMMQVPLMWVTELLKSRFKNDRVGNIIFWVSFCFLGQPLAQILYFHDWRKKTQAL